MANADENPFFQSSHADLALRAFELAKLAARDLSEARAATSSNPHRSIWLQLPVIMPERRMPNPFDTLIALCWHHLTAIRDCYVAASADARLRRLVQRLVGEHLRAHDAHGGPAAGASSQAPPTDADSADGAGAVKVLLHERAFKLYNDWHRRILGTRKLIKAESDTGVTIDQRRGFARVDEAILHNENELQFELASMLADLQPKAGLRPKGGLDRPANVQRFNAVLRHLTDEAARKHYFTDTKPFQAWTAHLKTLASAETKRRPPSPPRRSKRLRDGAGSAA